jgi:signal transduction histidine kinase/ligand-binding sensor domain-containing protein/DNA-binding response OmpR family regulator
MMFSKKISIKLFFSCLILLSEFLFAQSPVKFNHLSVEDGLSQSSVLSIEQDQSGFLWFGCSYGLNKYDGKNFKIYHHNPENKTTISSDNSIKVFKGADNKIWVLSFAGLDVYNERLDNFTRVLKKEGLRYFFQDKNGGIWLGTSDGLIFTDNLRKPDFKLFSLLKTNKGLIINNIYQDKENKLWIGSNKGLFCIDHNQITYVKNFKNGTEELNISAITQDNQQNLWLGTIGKGIYVWNPKSKLLIKNFTQSIADKQSLANNDVFKIIKTKTGNFWIGTQTGLSIINPNTYSVRTYKNIPSDINSLSHNSIYDVFEDKNGSVWIATYYGGVNVVHQASTPFKVISADDETKNFNVNVISTLYQDEKNELWVGTENSGLNHLDKNLNKINVFRQDTNNPFSIKSNHVKGIVKDEKGRFWVATYKGGLNLFDQKSKKFTNFKTNPNDSTTIDANNIYSILIDSKKRFWVGTEQGLNLFNPETGQFRRSNVIEKEYKISGGFIMNLFEDSNHNLYVSNYLGLHILEVNAKQFKYIPYSTKANLSNNRINYIFEDSKKQLWIANFQGGITLFDNKKQTFKTYNTDNGLPSNDVLGILEDNNGMLWLSTSNGLSKFDVTKEVFNNYNQKDGLPSNEFNRTSCLKLQDGTLLFGNYKGLVSFNPDDIKVNLFAPAVQLTDLKLFNQSVKINDGNKLLKESISFTKEVVFDYDQNSFTLEFAALNYIQSDKNRYAYKLEGFDKEWQFGTNSSATYANLLPGNYQFLVKAANNNGVWTSSVRTLNISVLNPPWKTWWAYLLYCSIGVTIAFLLIRYVKIRTRLKQEEEIHQLKLDFFTNISHEIRTPLTLIKGPVEELILEPNQNNKESLIQVKNNTDRLLRLVNELMDFRKAEAGKLDLEVQKHNLITLLDEICHSFNGLAKNKNISLNFSTSIKELDMYFDKNQLEKVFYNLLSNAFKFTPKGGEVSISVKESATDCTVEITDNGFGISEEDQKNLFRKFFQSKLQQVEMPGSGIGLAFSKSILELHRGSITVESKQAQNGENGLSVFSVKLLKGLKHFNKHSLKESKSEENYQIVNDFDVVEDDFFIDVQEHADIQILVIEDNTEIREFIKNSLNKTYQIETAKDGTEGIEKAFEILPDIIISDVKMPGKDGLEVCKLIKTDDRTSHIPIILLTARTSHIHQLSGLENGADVYLTKPFSLYMLKLNIKNLLKVRSAMRDRFSQEMMLKPTNVIVNQADEKFLNRLMQIIEEHIDDSEFDVEQLITEVGMSKRVLYKKLSSLTNMTAADFVRSVRLKKAAMLLEDGSFNVSEVAFSVGFNDPKYFTKSFKKQFGKSPREYQNELIH